jgi:hypothetical protein
MNRGKRTTRRAHVSPRWALERLEDRTLLSGNVTATVTNAGNLLVVGDAKGNEILIQSTSGGALQISSLDGTTTINGGSTPFSTTGVTGNVAVFMKQGADVVDVGGTGMLTTLPKNLFIDTGSGDDTVDVENASIAGNVAIFGGAGSDTFTIGSSNSETAVSVGGSVYIVGGTADSNTIAVFDANITGDLRIFGRGADDQIQVGFDAGLGLIGVTETAHVNIGGNLEIKTPSGDRCFSHDQFGFDDQFGNSWDGMGDSLMSGLGWGSFGSFGSFNLGKSLSNDLAFLRGWCGGDGGNGGGWGQGDGGDGGGNSSSGTEHVSVADVSVTGNIKIHTGNGADQILLGAAPIPSDDTSQPLNLVFGPVNVGGNLHVNGGNGNNTILVDQVSVTGNTGIKTGSGNDDIAVLGNSASFTGTFKIDSGSGKDAIAIINGATFQSTVTIKAGKGADVLYVAQSLFMDTTTFDGGAGSNTLLESQSIFPNSFTAGNPVVNSFAIQMLDVSPTDTIVTTNFGWLNSLLGISP